MIEDEEATESVCSLASKSTSCSNNLRTQHQKHQHTCRLNYDANYRVEFAQQIPEELTCLICSFVTKEPQKMACCGRLYCRKCITEFSKKARKCPNCQMYYPKSAVDDVSADRVQGFLVTCHNSLKGCQWIGSLRELTAHRMSCSRETVRCSKHDIGCRVKMCREEIAEHESESKGAHLECAFQTIVKLRKKQCELLRALHDVKRMYQPRIPTAVYQMTKFAEHKAEKKCWYSLPFYSHPGGYKMCLRVDAAGIDTFHESYLSLFVCLMQGENDSTLIWPFRGKIEIELLNQLEDHCHHCGTVRFESNEKEECNSRVVCIVSASGRGWPLFIKHKSLDYNAEKACQYLKDDSLFFRVTRVEVFDSNKPWLAPVNSQMLF